MSKRLTLEQSYNLFFKDYPDVLNTEQIREILNISNKTLFQLLRTGKIHSIKVGRSYRIPKIFLMKYLDINISEE